jgi:hypothetical protein
MIAKRNAKMPQQTFTSVNLEKATELLPSLHKRVVHQQHRVEIRQKGIVGAAVMISKQELDAMEEALVILSRGSVSRRASTMLHKLAQHSSIK